MDCYEQPLSHDSVTRILRQLQLKKARMCHRQHLIGRIFITQLKRLGPVVTLGQSRPTPGEPQEQASVLVAQPPHHSPEPLHHLMPLGPTNVNRVEFQRVDRDLHRNSSSSSPLPPAPPSPRAPAAPT